MTRSMKKKQLRQRRKPKRSAADVVADMAASGLVEDEIAQRLGIHKNVLRARHIDSIKAGKAAAAVSEAGAEALTQSQYHFLNAAALSFDEGSWITDGRNDLFRGIDGNGAKDLADAYAFWASNNGERFNTTGLSSRFDPVKAIRFAEIVNNYKRGKTHG
jgi:hypothetical protein